MSSPRTRGSTVLARTSIPCPSLRSPFALYDLGCPRSPAGQRSSGLGVAFFAFFVASKSGLEAHFRHEGTELEQRVPVAPVSSQSRGLDRDHRANRALTYRRKQSFEARPLHARDRTAEILVKHDDLSPSKRSDTLWSAY